MSLPINLLITTLLIYVVGAFISLAVRRNEQLSINISGVTGILAGVLGIVACIPVLISSDTVVDVFKTPFEFASFSIRIDGLAAFMVCVIRNRTLFFLLCKRIQRQRRRFHGLLYEFIYRFHGCVSYQR